MAKNTTFGKALNDWEAEHNQNPADAEVIKFVFIVPPIDKMDGALISTLVNCKQLSISTNSIEKMVPINGLRNLEILSLARNMIKRINGLDEVAGSLKELWLSYNFIEKLDGINCCTELKILYIGHNKIKDWAEVDKLKDMENYRTTVMYGNDMYDKYGQGPVGLAEGRLQVFKRLPQLTMIDGVMVSEAERQANGTAE